MDDNKTGDVYEENDKSKVNDLEKELKKCRLEKANNEKEYLLCESELRVKTEEFEKLKIELKDTKEILKLKDELKENGLDESVIEDEGSSSPSNEGKIFQVKEMIYIERNKRKYLTALSAISQVLAMLKSSSIQT